MGLNGLVKLAPFVLAANALFFEPPSAKRNVPNRRSTGLHKRQGSGGTNWVKLGCYIDTLTPRTLPAAQTLSDTAMTNAYCQEYCNAHGYSIAGTEWTKECFCDNSINNSLLTSDADCDMTCTGAAETCGGGARLTVWKNQGTVTNPNTLTYGDWTGQGCYSDSVANRALPVRKYIDGMTVEKCTAACFGDGYKYAGLEYGSECYCANAIIANSGTTGTSVTDGCSMPCAGNPNEVCGGGNRLNVYLYTGSPANLPAAPSQLQSTGDWTLKGCYSDDGNNRALPTRAYVDGAMTVEKCTAKCLSLGQKLAGVEYSTECYCSQSIGSSGSPVAGGCAMPCEGAPSEICGGGNQLTIYEYTGTSLAASTVLATYNDWQSQGCFVDTVNSRAIPPMLNAVTPMTVEHCIDACVAAGFTVAGLEYASECYCGSQMPTVSATDGCSMKCDGDSAHICGGPNRLNVYKQVAASPAPPAQPAAPTQYRIRVTNANTGAVIGYFRKTLNVLGAVLVLTDEASAALKVIPSSPAADAGCLDLLATNSPSSTYTYVGAIPVDRYGGYQTMSMVAQTPPGSKPLALGSPLSATTQDESCIWKVDWTTSELSKIWVKPDGSTVPTTLTTLYGQITAALDIQTYLAQAPATSWPYLVKYYLEAV